MKKSCMIKLSKNNVIDKILAAVTGNSFPFVNAKGRLNLHFIPNQRLFALSDSFSLFPFSVQVPRLFFFLPYVAYFFNNWKMYKQE